MAGGQNTSGDSGMQKRSLTLKNAIPYISRNDEIVSELDLSQTLIDTGDAKELGQVWYLDCMNLAILE